MKFKEKMSHKDIFKVTDELQNEIWELRKVVDRLVDVLVLLEPNKKNKEMLGLIKKIN